MRALAALFVLGVVASCAPTRRPNIVWINADDASPHLGAYGETLIRTPHVDRLAREGVTFRNVFVTAPVCSPSRSALITGMYQTTTGFHNHRSQRAEGAEGIGGGAYVASYAVPAEVKLVPQLFREAGYYTVLAGAPPASKTGQLGKSDYNFVWPASLYDGSDWRGRAPGQPFFAQVMLHGGKHRRAKVADPVDPLRVKLPPYYPDHPVLREDWAEYLNSMVFMDQQVGEILARLDAEGLASDTVVFFFTDHGISHVRGKQFLYDEGLRVPLVVRWPGRLPAGGSRDDLVSHIDVAAASLDLAGIARPARMQARGLFRAGEPGRDYVYAARDRCDETVDVIRAVRDGRFKYIRNYHSRRSHAQPNVYKDGKKITQAMRRLHAEGKLDRFQARVFEPERPAEELYDLAADPHEATNLAGRPEHRATLARLRAAHERWMDETRDLGLIPEPELEELGLRHGSKHAVLARPEHRDLLARLRAVIRAGERGSEAPARLRQALGDGSPSVRYWAALGLGHVGGAQDLPALRAAMRDGSASVRIAAALAVGRLGGAEEAVPALAGELGASGAVVRLYASLALEELGPAARPALEAIARARQDPSDSVRRVAQRVLAALGEGATTAAVPVRLPTGTGPATVGR